MPAAIIQGTTTPHETDKETGGIDETGKASAAVTYRVPTIQDAASYKRGDSHILGIPEKTRSWTLLTGEMGYETTINYEGYIGEEGEEDSNNYSLDISFSEEPIESHPNLAKIKETYKGTTDTEGKVKFIEELDDPDATPLSGGEGGKRKNPMFGVSTYLALKATFRHTYNSTKRPKLNVIGNIVDRIPGGFDTPDDHNWLVMPPKAQRAGRGVYQITQEYILSELGGWPEEVYNILGTSGANDANDEDPDAPFEPVTGWQL